jgi:hypothetical protein
MILEAKRQTLERLKLVTLKEEPLIQNSLKEQSHQLNILLAYTMESVLYFLVVLRSFYRLVVKFWLRQFVASMLVMTIFTENSFIIASYVT